MYITHYTRVADNEVKMVTDEYCKPLHFVVRGQFLHIEVEFVNHFVHGYQTQFSIGSLRNCIVNYVNAELFRNVSKFQ